MLFLSCFLKRKERMRMRKRKRKIKPAHLQEGHR